MSIFSATLDDLEVNFFSGTTTAGDVQEATSSNDHWNVLLNLYSTSTSNGRTAPAATATSVVFWGLQGADQAWWSSDLKDIQVQNENLNPRAVGI